MSVESNVRNSELNKNAVKKNAIQVPHTSDRDQSTSSSITITSPRMRTSTMNFDAELPKDDLTLSPVNLNRINSPRHERDKSSKRKSNLNRALNEEATVEGKIFFLFLFWYRNVFLCITNLTQNKR